MRDDYTTNALNQYVTRENNTVPVSGTAEPDAGGAGGVAVAVGGGTTTPVAAGRQGRYWNDEVSVSNTSAPWRGPLAIYAVKRSSGSGDLFKVESRMAEIAAALQSFSYDYDGNLLSDGLVDYSWDAENRLTRMETSTAARTAGFPHREITFRYDYMGRRVQKRVVDVTLSQEISARRFLYDGWNLVAEYAAPGGTTCGAMVRSYTWGLDIVNTMASAGGVGALLQIADHPSGKTFLPTYDGNGNIAALLNASTGALAAAYEYSPYGEPLRAQTFDSTVADNPFRFSTKYTDVETGLVYYGRRYFDPKNGRFINRDPIEESGGLNFYGFCGNNAINAWDVLGLDGVTATNGTFMASVTDALGQFREWNFSSKTDAENWIAAWGTGDANLLQPYMRQMAQNEADAFAATLQKDVTVAKIYLGGLGLSSTLQNIYGGISSGDSTVDDDGALDALFDRYDIGTVFTMVLGTSTPKITAKTITLVAGADSSVSGGLSVADRQAFVENVTNIQNLLVSVNALDVKVFLLFSNNVPIAPGVQYRFRPRTYPDRTVPYYSTNADAGFKLLGGETGGVVPIICTNREIWTETATEIRKPAGVGLSLKNAPNAGIVLNLDYIGLNKYAIAHELGHVGDYINPHVPASSGLRSHYPSLGWNASSNVMHEYGGVAAPPKTSIWVAPTAV